MQAVSARFPSADPAAGESAAWRLGFAVRIVSRAGLRSHDASQSAHLSVSLVYLRDILAYLRRSDVQFYRLSSSLLPPTAITSGLQQLAACRRELGTLAEQVQAQQVRLTMHMPPHVALGHRDDAQVARSLQHIEVQAALLEALGSGSDGSIVVHVGASSADSASLARFARRYTALSARARSRLVVEHDSAGFSLGHLLHLHQMCGIPVVFDYLHWQLHNPEQVPLELALGLALATWPPGVRPKVHLSSARSEAHLLPGHHGGMRVLPPRHGQHADFVAIADALCLLAAARGLPTFDIMVEAKGGDMALLRLRDELGRKSKDTIAARSLYRLS